MNIHYYKIKISSFLWNIEMQKKDLEKGEEINHVLESIKDFDTPIFLQEDLVIYKESSLVSNAFQSESHISNMM